MDSLAERPAIGLIAARAVRCLCPNCGKAALFTGYVTQVPVCPRCGVGFGHIRADDGPAWLTILITGHLIVGLILSVEPYVDWPQWLSSLVWVTAAIALTLIILPRAKAFFIGLIWRSGAPGSER